MAYEQKKEGGNYVTLQLCQTQCDISYKIYWTNMNMAIITNGLHQTSTLLRTIQNQPKGKRAEMLVGILSTP